MLSDISPIAFLNFTGVRKCKILARFLTPVAFDGLWLTNGGTFQKPNTYGLSDVGVHIDYKEYFRKNAKLGTNWGVA